MQEEGGLWEGWDLQHLTTNPISSWTSSAPGTNKKYKDFEFFRYHSHVKINDVPGVFQDFTSVAALVDLAALRDEVANSGGDPSTVDSLCPADLVVDNFAQVTAVTGAKSIKLITFPLCIFVDLTTRM